MPTYYKSLTETGNAMHGGTLTYDLPKQRHDGTWMPGAWMPHVYGVVPCEQGYHVWTQRNALSWLGPTIWKAELRKNKHSVIIDHDDKFVGSDIRLTEGTAWNEQTARLYAVQCAVDCLPNWEKQYPDDDRPSQALIAAWEFAYGLIDDTERSAAESAAGSARSAARSAAESAARSAAARSAARSVQQARLIKYLRGDIPLFPEWPAK